ncbi:MAG: hypothetical protein DI589_22875 [Shinella sp.]|nr:MAG: hypothetical protein DI589_22875 [Shinella sp.]
MTGTPLSALTGGLNRLQEMFSPFANIADGEAIEITAADVRVLLQSIRTMRHLALLADRELGALRMIEEGRTVKMAVWRELDLSMDDNVIRPDFGGRS